MSKIIGDSLSKELIDLFNKESVTVVMSTVTPEGNPHSMPVHLMAASDEKTIYIALVSAHQTVSNIKENGKAVISVLEGQDISLSFIGDVKVVKEPMEGSSVMCMVEFKVVEIKSDTTPTLIVTEGVRFKHRTDKTKDFFRAMFNELKQGKA